MSSDVKEILKAFGEMTSAYEDAPRQRQRIDELENTLAHLQEELELEIRLHKEKVDKIASLEGRLAETEVQRDQYSFRANEAQGKLDRIYGVVAPEPVVEGTSVTNPTNGTISGGADQEAQTIQSAPVQDTASSTAVTEGQSEVVPTSTTTGTKEDGNATSPLSQASTTPDTSGSLSESQSSHSTTTTTSSQSVGEEPSKSEGDVDYSVGKPYKDQPSWSKPVSMTWEEWEEKGGVVPYWVDRKSA